MSQTVVPEDLPTSEPSAQRDPASKAPRPAESSSNGTDFSPALRLIELPPVAVTAINLPDSRSFRSRNPITRSDPDQVRLAIPGSGRYWFGAPGREIEIGSGDLILHDSSCPLESWAPLCDSDCCQLIIVQFPKRLLPFPADQLASLLPVLSPGDRGLGAVLSGFVRQLTKIPPRTRPADAARLGKLTADLIAAWCARTLESQIPSQESRDGVPLPAMRDDPDDIDRRLANPDERR